jgi:hypothetical protein
MIEPRTDYERQIVECVEQFGCFAVSVSPLEASNGPHFTYSIGFTKSLSQPEVIFFGLPADTAHALINDLFGMCQDGLKLDDGVRVDNLVANYPIIARTVDESWIIQSYFASALWYHRTQMDASFEQALQMVWPDAESVFPWQPGCADWVRADQPALYRPRIAP